MDEETPAMVFEPTDVPVPHWKTAPLPFDPPIAVKLVEPPPQAILFVPSILVGGEGGVSTVIDFVTPLVQTPQ